MKRREILEKLLDAKVQADAWDVGGTIELQGSRSGTTTITMDVMRQLEELLGRKPFEMDISPETATDDHCSCGAFHLQYYEYLDISIVPGGEE